MLMFCPPGTYRAQDDTALLIEVLRRTGWARDRHVLDLCTGPGTVAIAAARAGAASVTAVELSRRSAAAAWVNRVLNRAPVTVRRGDLFDPVAGSRFDLITANPPYVPSRSARLPRHRAARSWDAGVDGRAVLDRLCAGATRYLRPGGRVLVVHSEVCDPERTLDQLAAHGMRGEVLAEARIPFGAVMRERAAMLRNRGLTEHGVDVERIVVIGGHREP